MTNTNVLELELPDVTIDDIFQAQGSFYGDRKPSPKIVALNRRILDEAVELVRPVMVWQEIAIAQAAGDELFLEGGHKLTSRLLARIAGQGDKLVLYMLTIGSAIDQRVEAYMKGNEIGNAFALDAAGSAFVAKSAALAEELITKEFLAGQKTTFSLGPGHSYWQKLDDLRTIHQLVNGELIGINLTTSNLMLPKKSVAMTMGVGNNLPDLEGKVHCDFCSLQKNCQMRGFSQSC